jgi:integrase/recombinase XerC
MNDPMQEATVSDYLADFATHLRAAGVRPRTLRLRMHYAESICRLGDPTTLEASAVEAWVHPTGKQFAPATIRSRRASARRFLGWLHESGRATSDPTERLAAVRVPVKPPRLIPDDVFRQALTAADSRGRAVLMLGRYACLRLTEIATLRVEHREGERLRIDGKGGTVRYVWLAPETQELLDELEATATDGWYFPGRFTGHMHPEALHKLIKRLTGGWNPHSLRHAGATAAYRGTRNLRGVQAMLGHASLATTQRYLTVADDEMRALALATQLQPQAQP